MAQSKTQAIEIKGARVHNLKNVSLSVPRDKFVVITGLSGSGKSSLAFDTLYAEGQRRYVESLSAYARQFLGRIDKPEVDFIKGIPPAIAIEQRVNTRNPRSTVGTSTEIYDYLKLLFARIGRTYSPVSGELVKRHNVSDVVNHLLDFPEGTRAMVLAPVFESQKKRQGPAVAKKLQVLSQQGFSRIEIKKRDAGAYEVLKINDCVEDKKLLNAVCCVRIVVDRLVAQNDNDTQARMADSVQTAFFEGKGICVTKVFRDDEVIENLFSNRFEADGITFEEPTVHTFSFNNPLGACSTCEGFGKVLGIDEDLVVPNKNLSIYEDAIACWRGEKMGRWKMRLVNNASNFDFPIHRPYYQLTSEERRLLWRGNSYFEGLNSFFKMLEKEKHKIQYRVMLSRYRGKTICPECEGTRLKKEAGYVKIAGKSIQELVLMPIYRLKAFFDDFSLNAHDTEIARRLLIEINSRLDFLLNVGLGYLTLNRLSASLSGGESQRINLATSLGSSLVGSLYILDEPSIGLHPRDTTRLINVLQHLRNLGNTVLVVEHDEEIIRAAEEIIDIGPHAGSNGGEIVFQGTHQNLLSAKNSLTTQYLTGQMQVPVPQYRRKWNNFVEVVNARENNLKNVSVKFPLNVMTVVTGVSGSGKSSLVNSVLYNALQKELKGYTQQHSKYDMLQGDLHLLDLAELVDQNPIGKSSRSNPATYIDAYDDIRRLFTAQQASKIAGFKPSHFSFNVEGGRCEECQGAGIIKVEMQFMADVHLVCETCKGQRFKQEVLDVKFEDKNIYEVLEMTVDDALAFFKTKKHAHIKNIVQKIQLLADVGLGYVKLGQPSNTLSGGESQRIKLASFLGREKTNKSSFFIFDEPTTGLHFHDISTLLKAFEALLDKGHTIVIIEHNLEIIKSADWIIDLGPEGGEHGGEVMFEGTPDELLDNKKSYTAKYLKEKLKS